jgi:hypothetical protein
MFYKWKCMFLFSPKRLKLSYFIKTTGKSTSSNLQANVAGVTSGVCWWVARPRIYGARFESRHVHRSAEVSGILSLIRQAGSARAFMGQAAAGS